MTETTKIGVLNEFGTTYNQGGSGEFTVYDTGKMAETIAALRVQFAEVRILVSAIGRRKHYECDDCWYSCPLSDDGCCNDSRKMECDCGADDFNAQLDALLAALDDN